MVKKFAIILFLFLLFPSSANAAEWFASPSGTSGGSGSISDPWDLTTALTKALSNIAAGDTLWLRSGTYGTGGGTIFVTDLDGADGNPILIRNYNKERAIIDGGIHATTSSSWITFWGLEVTNSYSERVASTSERVYGIEMRGLGIKIINCILHNTGHPGIGFWDQVGDGGEIYGTLIWGTGLYDTDYDPDLTRGSGIYAQNQNGNRYIHDVITFRNFTTGFKAYSEGAYVNGFDIQGNISFDNNEANIFTSSASNPMQGQVVSNNYTYQRRDYGGGSIELGYAGDHSDLLVQNNYIVAGSTSNGVLRLHRWREATVDSNTIVGQEVLGARTLPNSGFVSTSWDDNDYYSLNNETFLNATSEVDFATWKSVTGYDATSTLTDSKPTGTRIFVRPNSYEEGRGHVAVYNWDLRTNTSVDLSSVLELGQEYEIVDAQNYFGDPVAQGVYDGSSIVLPLVLTEVSEITGTIVHDVPSGHTPSEFNAFVVIGGDIGTLPTATPTPTASPSTGSASTSSDSGTAVTTVVPVSSSAITTSQTFSSTGVSDTDGELNINNGLTFKGKSAVGSFVTINLHKDDEMMFAETVRPNAQGSWLWETDSLLEEGTYIISFDTRIKGESINVVKINFSVDEEGVITISQSSQEIFQYSLGNRPTELSIIQKFLNFAKDVLVFPIIYIAKKVSL